jgi:glycosyltransferase involved in cell wall biosynthesis
MSAGALSNAPETSAVLASTSVVAVVIGRNEGQRLLGCFRSLMHQCDDIVYVDSGSSDGSVESARQHGVHVHSLDTTIPFTAARARNAGFRLAVDVRPDVDFVQFVDGDCEVAPDWIANAHRYLIQHESAAVAFGSQSERFPDRSIYNQLMDLEWRWPIGVVKSFAGNFMCRAQVFAAAGGFRETLIAAEDSELSVRIRQIGGRIHSLPVPMTVHDAHMMHARQWLLRASRAGYAFAEGVDLHGRGPEKHFVLERRRALCWGLIPPALTAMLVAAFGVVGLITLVIYPMQSARIFMLTAGSARERAVYAALTVLGKPAEAFGVLKYLFLRCVGRRSALIEYK